MKTKDEIIARLKKYPSDTPSKWAETARWRKENRRWLRYSQQIALMMLNAMEKQHISQRQLAERMGCSQQYVSKLLKGQENLSIETITKIEDALSLTVFQGEYV